MVGQINRINSWSNPFESDLKTMDIDPKNDNGLFFGPTGISLTAYIISRFTNNKILQNEAYAKLLEISSVLTGERFQNFASGSLGFGFVVDWLKENNFIKDDTNYLLEGIDDFLYRRIVFRPHEDITISHGLAGDLAYLVGRLTSIDSSTHLFRWILIQEQIIIVTDRFKSILCDAIKSKDISVSLINCTAYLSNFFSKIKDINKECMNEIFKYVSRLSKKFAVTFFKLFRDKKATNSAVLDFLYFNVSIYKLANQLENASLALSSEKNISACSFSVKEIMSGSEKDRFKAAIVFSLLAVQFPNRQYHEFAHEILSSFNSENRFVFRGSATLVLLRLYVDNFSKLKGWERLFFYTE